MGKIGDSLTFRQRLQTARTLKQIPAQNYTFKALEGPSEIASASCVSNQKGGVLGIVFN
jgi:hypothetical protein